MFGTDTNPRRRGARYPKLREHEREYLRTWIVREFGSVAEAARLLHRNKASLGYWLGGSQGLPEDEFVALAAMRGRTPDQLRAEAAALKAAANGHAGPDVIERLAELERTVAQIKQAGQPPGQCPDKPGSNSPPPAPDYGLLISPAPPPPLHRGMETVETVSTEEWVALAHTDGRRRFRVRREAATLPPDILVGDELWVELGDRLVEDGAVVLVLLPGERAPRLRRYYRAGGTSTCPVLVAGKRLPLLDEGAELSQDEAHGFERVAIGFGGRAFGRLRWGHEGHPFSTLWRSGFAGIMVGSPLPGHHRAERPPTRTTPCGRGSARCSA